MLKYMLVIQSEYMEMGMIDSQGMFWCCVGMITFQLDLAVESKSVDPQFDIDNQLIIGV